MGAKVFFEAKFGRKMGFFIVIYRLSLIFYDKNEEKGRKKPSKDEDKIENELGRIQRGKSGLFIIKR